MSQATDTSAAAASAPAAQATANDVGSASLLGSTSAQADTTGNTLLGSTDASQTGTAPSPASEGGEATSQASSPEPSAPVEGLAPLPDDASDDQRADFDKKMRALNKVPSDADGYGDFGFGDEYKVDTSSEDYKYYTKVFHDIGINKAQAKKLLEAHVKYANEAVEHRKRQDEAVITEYRAKVKEALVKECGGEEQFRHYNDVAVRGFKAAAQGAGLSENDTRGILSIVGDDPRFVKLFHNIGSQFSDDVLITGTAPRVKEKTFEDMFGSMFNKNGG